MSINGIHLFAVKNTFSGTHLRLFSPLEFIRVKENLDEDERLLFRTSVNKARTRLEILGCSEEKLKTYFKSGLEYQQSNNLEHNCDDDDEQMYYRDLTFENYSNCLRSILEISNLDIYNDDIMKIYPHLSIQPISKVIIEKLSSGGYLNPFFYDEIYENEEHLLDYLLDIYMCLINSQDDTFVEYDLTHIIHGRWVDEFEVLKYYDNFMDTTVIVTEGKTDIKILSRSLEILFPEYKHLFTFFDFHNYKADGGASYLTKLIKSFSAARIRNRIVAVFDNDTAAEAEIQSLLTIPILKNIKIIKLPKLDFCSSYPTLGPTGKSYLDINGLAVSIELFFGEDIIKNNHEFFPIKWTNYVEKLDMYQGSIVNKGELIIKMEEKLNNPDLNNQDWSKLILLWESIFLADLSAN